MAVAPSESVNALILAIYEGVLEDKPWQGFVELLRSVFSADAAVLLMSGRGVEEQVFFKRMLTATDELDVDINDWISYDPLQGADFDTVVAWQDLTAETEFLQSPCYTGFLLPAGLYHVAGINIHLAQNPDFIVRIRVARKPEGEAFSQELRSILGSLVNHFRLASRFFDDRALAQIERNVFADALNQMMLGSFIVDAGGRLTASNRIARDAFEDMEALSLEDGIFKIRDQRLNKQFYEVLASIDDNSYGAVSRTLKLGDEVGLTLRPIRAEDRSNYPLHSQAVVFLSDPKGVQDIPTATLRDLFGLTETEAKVAVMLTNGLTIDEVAEDMGVSKNTAKTHAKNIYDKTGVNRQIKLIQLISNSVARVSI